MLLALFSQLSVFSKVFVMNILFHFLLPLCLSCRGLRNASLASRILSFYQKCLSRLAEYDDVIRGRPFLVLPRAPPNPKPVVPNRWVATQSGSRRSFCGVANSSLYSLLKSRIFRTSYIDILLHQQNRNTEIFVKLTLSPT